MDRLEGLDEHIEWQVKGKTFEAYCDFVGDQYGARSTRAPDGAPFEWQFNFNAIGAATASGDKPLEAIRFMCTGGFSQRPGDATGRITIVVPLLGRLTVVKGGAELTCAPGQAVVYQPSLVDDTRVATDGGIYEAVGLRFSFAAVRAILNGALHLPIERDLKMGEVVDLSIPKFKFLTDLIVSVCAQNFAFDRQVMSETAQNHLVQTFGHMLLENVRHRYSDRLVASEKGPMPNYVRLAHAYMQKNAGAFPTMVEIARVAKVSQRTLEIGFRNYFDVTPAAYLRTLRLKQARDALLHAPDDASIAEVSRRFGFAHTSRFAKYYNEIFGEMPSDTRRKAIEARRAD